MKTMIRQGDVLLVEVDAVIPQQATRHASVILAEGEITGHNHKLLADAGVVTWDDFVCVLGDVPGSLQHEDHDPEPVKVVPSGVVFQVVHQREFTLDQQWKRVID